MRAASAAIPPVLILLVTACGSGAMKIDAPRIAPEQLLGAAPLHASFSPQPHDVLTVTGDMKAFLDAHVERRATDSTKLAQLVSAIIDSKTFGLDYDDVTRTASETYRMRRGNCLSFANMFVAMARDVGLIVEYQEVDIPPDWTLDKETYVLNQHINVRVNLGRGGTRVVDFNIADFRSSYEMRTISDERAQAHYFNNVGVERMLAGDTAGAASSFVTALEHDRRFAPAWTNLGTLYLRNDVRDYAEAAYLQALQCGDSDLVAMSDLARFYELTGDRDRAAAYKKRVLYHRQLNPYYRYELARGAYGAKQYDEAIGHLKYAIRKRPKEDRFYYLLGLTYLQKGDQQAARHWLTEAEAVAATDAAKRRYSNKIDILLKKKGGP